MNNKIKVISFRVPKAIAVRVSGRCIHPSETLSDLCRMSFFAILQMDEAEYSEFIRKAKRGILEWKRDQLDRESKKLIRKSHEITEQLEQCKDRVI